MYNKTLKFFILSIFLASPHVYADTIKLKDGTTLEGKILEESPTTIKIEYNVTKGIKDTKSINRSEITEIDKESADEIAFNALKSLLPTDDLLSVDDYNKIIGDKPAKFFALYPSSKLKDSVQKIVDELEKEKTVAESGGIKLNGKWITGDEAAKDPYNHQAHILAVKIIKATKGNNYSLALDHFDELQMNYANSLAYSETIPLIKEALPKYDVTLNREEKSYEARIKERKDQYKSMEDEDKKRTEAAFQAGLKKFQLRRKEAKELKKIWLPVNKWDLGSILDARRTIVKEIDKLESLNLVLIKSTANALSNAFKAFADGELETAKSQLEIAQNNGVRGETINKLRDNLRDSLKADAEAKRAAAIAAAAAEAEQAAKKEEEAREQKKKNTAAEKASREAAAAIAAAEKASREAAAKKGGFSFRTILIILSIILIGITICAKIFLKPEEELLQEGEGEGEGEEN